MLLAELRHRLGKLCFLVLVLLQRGLAKRPLLLLMRLEKCVANLLLLGLHLL